MRRRTAGPAVVRSRGLSALRGPQHTPDQLGDRLGRERPRRVRDRAHRLALVELRQQGLPGRRCVAGSHQQHRFAGGGIG